MKALTLSASDFQKIQEAATLIVLNLKYHLTISELSSKVALNERKLKQGFKQLYGMGVFAYLLQHRMEKAKEMLLQDYPIKATAIAIGYKGDNAETNFIRSFKKLYSLSPASWKKQQLAVKWLHKGRHSA